MCGFAQFDAKWLVIGVCIALAAWLTLVPVVFLVWQSFLSPETADAPARLTFENYREAYSSAETVRLFANSVTFARRFVRVCLRHRHVFRLGQ